MRYTRIVTAVLVVFATYSISAKEAGLLTASGFGTADLSSVTIAAQAKMMARRAAIVDAQRNLSEQIKGIRLTGGTTMEEYEISSDIVATRVKSLLAGAFEYDQIISEDAQSVSVEVVMAICVNNEPEVCRSRMNMQEIEQFIQSNQPAGNE
ncbi:MAG: hypothetical protein NWQ54_20015 [Paraglaciecola sp.]|uniref:hypothetical protein n=1 Tax=Paraglaciecola sp. TaxID=1920173 RepID=UPI00273D99CD|nr:hypothetical protein [Paraglaciecola sp.]MDP5031400.1 hypothetical protein [Paraglaciecola sp.]MDP5133174.1 hypothetical protein [Paraglaciecola sp.]